MGKVWTKEEVEEFILATAGQGERVVPMFNLNRFLCENTDWLKAPASARYHNNFEGGLIAHSMKVTKQLVEHRTILGLGMLDEEIDKMITTLVLLGMFHDCGKAGGVGIPLYGENRGVKGQLLKVPYKKDMARLAALPDGMRSIIYISNNVSLTEDETHAIAWHSGLYNPGYRETKEYERPLTTYLHMIDNFVAKFIEGTTRNE